MTTATGAAETTAAPGLLTATTSPACCGITRELALSRGEAERTATLLKAVADPTRLQLLALIRASEGSEACVCDLTAPVGLTQPTVSHHLKVLMEAGLLRREKRGTWAWFVLVPERLEDLAAIFR